MYVRPEIAAMEGYTPGEQPQAGKFIKLNTNENPYPPSAAIRRAIEAREVRRFEHSESGDFVLTVRVENQSDANALVDALRQQDVAIVALSRHRQTLEEAFLAILADGERVGLADSAHPTATTAIEIP